MDYYRIGGASLAQSTLFKTISGSPGCGSILFAFVDYNDMILRKNNLQGIYIRLKTDNYGKDIEGNRPRICGTESQREH